MDVMLLLKASVLLSLSLLAVRALRGAPAASRHGLWTLTFAALLALPLLALALPGIDVPLPRWMAPAPTAATIDEPRAFAAPRRSSGEVASSASQPAAQTGHRPQMQRTPIELANSPHVAPPADIATRQRTWPAVVVTVSTLLLAVWLLGALASAAALGLSLVRVRRLSRASRPVADDAWQRAADDLGVRLGLSRRARLLVSGEVGTPMAAGLWRPTIFLPEESRTWSAECRDVVLAHEIAHLAVRDPLRHVTARLAVACYWFHPLTWLAARHAAIAREQACDEAVLALGTRPSTYARVLLDLAASSRPAPALGALPMVDGSLLETRLMAILDDSHPAIRRRLVWPAIGAALLICTVAAVRPGAATPASPVAAQSVVSTASAPRSMQPAPHSAFVASMRAASQAGSTRQSACASEAWDSPSFNGSVSVTTGGGTVIREQIGSRGLDRVILKRHGDLQLCMVAEGVGERESAERPSQWIGRARRVVLESSRGGAAQRFEILGQGAGQQAKWLVGGVERPVDAAAQAWRDRMLAALDTTWELSTLRGQVSSLHGEISSIHGQESSLRGEISSLRGEVSSMHGRASSVRGQESSLRGEISSIEGHVSSLRGSISSEHGAISSLGAHREGADQAERARIAARVREHEDAIARIEREVKDYDAAARIAKVEREIAALNADGKAAEIEGQIRAFDLNGKVAAVERRIAELDVPGKVAEIERRIQKLDADRRGRELEDRRDGEIKQLEKAIAAIR